MSAEPTTDEVRHGRALYLLWICLQPVDGFKPTIMDLDEVTKVQPECGPAKMLLEIKEALRVVDEEGATRATAETLEWCANQVESAHVKGGARIAVAIRARKP